MSRAPFIKPRTYGKLALAALLALTFCMVNPASTAYAKKRKLAKYGSIKILSTPVSLSEAWSPPYTQKKRKRF